MPVWHSDKIWPNGRVPYEPTDMEPVLKAIEDFHKCIGFEIFVERKPDDRNHVVFRSQTLGCSDIGCQGGRTEDYRKGQPVGDRS